MKIAISERTLTGCTADSGSVADGQFSTVERGLIGKPRNGSLPQTLSTQTVLVATTRGSLQWTTTRYSSHGFAYAAWRALSGWGGNAAPFLSAMGLFLMPYFGIAISLWPMIVPGHFSLWEAASSDSMQAFLLIGTLLDVAGPIRCFAAGCVPDIGYQ